MKDTVNNISLDKSNKEFYTAVKFVLETNRNLFLTGKAGTGKTTFLKFIKQSTSKNTIVLSQTGVAAMNAGGVTINSFFQLPFGPFVPNDSRLRYTSNDPKNKETVYTTFTYRKEKLELIRNLELLIIDEVSMVRADTLDVIDKLLRVFRNNPLPFGGVQVVLIGDAFQLPPIAKNDERNILKQFYETPYFFSSKVMFEYTPLHIELKKIYRQSEENFINLLNKVRVNKLDATDFRLLKEKYNPTFNSNESSHIILATHNNIVNETNLSKINLLKTERFDFEAEISGNFPKNIMPTVATLTLKEGAQVMFIKNDKNKRYFNGKIGKIKKLSEDQIIISFDNGKEVAIEMATWENIKYTYNKKKNKIEEEIIGTFEQFPIRLAWAITVHKSQGLTFEKVIADLGNAFAPGQVYVALSRCTTLEGLVLKTPIGSDAIITDPVVLEFAKKITPEILITKEMINGKADFHYSEAVKYLKTKKYTKAIDNLVAAIEYRDDTGTEKFEKISRIYIQRLFSNSKIEQDSLEELINNKKYTSINKILKSILDIAIKVKYIEQKPKEIKETTSKTTGLSIDVSVLKALMNNNNYITI